MNFFTGGSFILDNGILAKSEGLKKNVLMYLFLTKFTAFYFTRH